MSSVEFLKSIESFKNEDGSYTFSKEDTISLKEKVNNFVETLKKRNEKPKRGSSAFMLWLNEHREEIKSKYPEVTKGRGGISKKAGELWNDIKENDVEQFKKYEELSNKDRTRYKNEMAEYKNMVGDIKKETVPKRRGRPRKEKDSSKSSTKNKKTIKNNESNTNTEASEDIELDSIIFKGKEYWLDISKGHVYDEDGSEIVGEYSNGIILY